MHNHSHLNNLHQLINNGAIQLKSLLHNIKGHSVGMTPPGTHISWTCSADISPWFEWWQRFVGAKKFRGLASKEKVAGWISGLNWVQVLKVEWQVKHSYYLTRISPHHNFIQSYQIAIWVIHTREYKIDLWSVFFLSKEVIIFMDIDSKYKSNIYGVFICSNL